MSRNLVLSACLILWGSSAWAEITAADAAAPQSDTMAQEELAEMVLDEEQLTAAEKIFKKSCRACHGNKGQGASSYPNIADLEPDYIADKLERYRAGEKFGPNSILMIQHAKKLSDEDIVNISVYVATAFD